MAVSNKEQIIMAHIQYMKIGNVFCLICLNYLLNCVGTFWPEKLKKSIKTVIGHVSFQHAKPSQQMPQCIIKLHNFRST